MARHLCGNLWWELQTETIIPSLHKLIWCIFLYDTLTFVILNYKELANFKNTFGLSEIVVITTLKHWHEHTHVFKMEIVAAPPPSIDRSTHHWNICVCSWNAWCWCKHNPHLQTNLCVLMSMLGEGTATISTLNVCVCVCVLSCQFLEVEEWVKGHSARPCPIMLIFFAYYSILLCCLVLPIILLNPTYYSHELTHYSSIIRWSENSELL